MDGSPRGSTVPGILQARTLEWVAISFSNAWKWKVKVKSLSCVQLFATPWIAAYQAPLSMGFSRQEYWSGMPLPSPGSGGEISSLKKKAGPTGRLCTNSGREFWLHGDKLTSESWNFPNWKHIQIHLKSEHVVQGCHQTKLGSAHLHRKANRLTLGCAEGKYRVYYRAPGKESKHLARLKDLNSDGLQQFSSVTQLCPTLWDPMDCSMPGLPVHHKLLEFIQTHIHWVGDAIQPSYLLSSPSPTFSLSQHQGLFQWVSSSHQVDKYWRFSFSFSPSNEHPELISFRMDWLDLLAIQGILKSLLQHHSSKASFLIIF